MAISYKFKLGSTTNITFLFTNNLKKNAKVTLTVYKKVLKRNWFRDVYFVAIIQNCRKY